MDLSVLEGNDPAGYRAEKRIQAAKRRATEPFSGKPRRFKNPGNAFVSEIVQTSSYRRNRQKDLDKLDFAAKQRRKEAEQEAYQLKKEQLCKALEEKTAKRREKRHHKKKKKEGASHDEKKLIKNDGSGDGGGKDLENNE